MARKSKKKDSFRPWEKRLGSPNPLYIRITHDMMESKAWAKLSLHGRALFLEIRKKFNGKNEENISFTYAEGEKLMSKKTFTKSIDQLIALGFIGIKHQGWAIREPNIYHFHFMWQHYGTKDFKVQERRKRGEINNSAGSDATV